MWHPWTSPLLVIAAVCGVDGQVPTVAWQLTTPDVALLRWQPQPPPPVGEKPQDTPKKGESTEKGEPRLKGRPIVMDPQARDEEEIELPTGPMRIEPFAVSESRIRYQGEPPESPGKSALRLQVTLTGGRLPEIVGWGHLVIEEAIDDTGAVLAGPEDIRRRDRSATSPIHVSKRILRQGFITRTAEVRAPSRTARKLTKVRGWINVIYATETEEIMVDDPLRYLGAYIEHPRLKELGMKIRVIEPGEEVDERRDGRGIALQFERCAKQIRHTEFFDAWLKPMYPQARRMETADGQDYMYYGVRRGLGKLDADVQMLLKVYPKIEEEAVRFSFEDLELP